MVLSCRLGLSHDTGPWGWDGARLGCQHVDQILLWSELSMAGKGRAGVELEISAAASVALGWTEMGS